MKKQKIAVISAYNSTSGIITDELQSLFGSCCEIKKLSLNDNLKACVDDCSLVVCSSKVVLNTVLRNISGLPVIEAKRNMSVDSLPEILNIKSGSCVYVVGSDENAAAEFINILREIGINHLHLIPYYFQHQLSREDIVISVSEKHPFKFNVKKVITLDYKTLNIYTAIEIFTKLNLPSEILSLILQKYSDDISDINKRTNLLNNYLQCILETVSDGLLCIDSNEEIIFCNKAFAELMEIDPVEITRKNYKRVIFEKSLLNIISKRNDIFYEIIEYKGKKMVVNKNHIPDSLGGFVLSIQDITKIQALEINVRKKLVHKGFAAKYTLNHLIGLSPLMQSKIEEAKKIAKSDFDVLIQGSNGTGKEMFAQAIHNASDRKSSPFVAINIAALSDSLIESELFGYEEGSFTGALKGGKPGLFEMAHRGTIFIDEIGDVSPIIQLRLLRVLQEREIMRVGGNRIIPIDARIIAATNKDLYKMVEEGNFRRDLYYRLKVLYIDLPDLKDRTEDIPLFIKYFFNSLNSSKHLTPAAMDIITAYSWPGNVRELQNFVYYLYSLCDKDEIGADDIPDSYKQNIKGNLKLNSEFEHIISLYNKKTIVEFYYILDKMITANNDNSVIGRKRLQVLLAHQGVDISMNQIRNRLIKLSNHQFIKVGTTRQGSKITSRGAEFFEYIKNMSVEQN